MRKNRLGRLTVSKFFWMFAELTALLVAQDVEMLEHPSGDPESEPDVVSRPYTTTLSWLLKDDQDLPYGSSHIGRNLVKHYDWDWERDTSAMVVRMGGPPAGVRNLAYLSQRLFPLVSHLPHIADNLAAHSHIVLRAAKLAAVVVARPTECNDEQAENARLILSQSYQFFEIMTAGLEMIIDKHATALGPDAASSQLSHLSAILGLCLDTNGNPACSLLERYNEVGDTFSRSMVMNDWTFAYQHKLILSGQMQLRVIGITSMCTNLLENYAKADKSGELQPTLSRLVELILDSKLLDYIVGVGSHPELISQSSNVVGFLNATKTYTNEHADMIWHAVATSQDPRVVDAMLAMLKGTLNVYDYGSLMYMCSKLMEMPLDSFTTTMREFCGQTFQTVVKLYRESIEYEYIDSIPYELCIRLIREACSRSAETGHVAVHRFAMTKLGELEAFGPSPKARQVMYNSCLDDIARQTPAAIGSMCVLASLLMAHSDDLRELTVTHGLTRLLIDDLEAATTQGTTKPFNPNSPVSISRREVLTLIILLAPETVTPELGVRLWNISVGVGATGNQAGQVSWRMLNNAAQKSTPSNAFINACFDEYLPNLPVQCFNAGALDFVSKGTYRNLPATLDDDVDCTTWGVEQLWRMVLSALPHTVEDQAIQNLITFYVESKFVLELQKSEAQTMHLAFVNRCFSQLSSAAAALKSAPLTTQGIQKQSAPSLIHGPIEELGLVFSRSLTLLRDFINAYQSRSPFNLSKPPLPPRNIEMPVKGGELEIKYQSFDGNNASQMQILRVGADNTVAVLFDLIEKATGFSYYKLYHLGQEFVRTIDNTEKTVAELNLNNFPFLVRRETEDGVDGGDSSHTPLESTLLKHSDELFGFLSMEDKLAKEASFTKDGIENQANMLADLRIPCQTPCLQQTSRCLGVGHFVP